MAESLTVTSPSGAETWPIRSTQNIAWTSSGVTGDVKVEVSRDGADVMGVVIGSTPNDGTPVPGR